MEGEVIAAEELLEELKAMIAVCFEGEAELCGNAVSLTLPNGQKFMIACRET